MLQVEQEKDKKEVIERLHLKVRNPSFTLYQREKWEDV